MDWRKYLPRYDLFGLVELIAGLAFLCALSSNSGGESAWTYQFQRLPPDDGALASWLRDRKRSDVRIERHDESLTLTWKTGVLFSVWRRTNPPQPPWRALGYSAPTGMRGKETWSLFRGSPYLWIIGISILLALSYLRRKLQRPVSAETADIAAR